MGRGNEDKRGVSRSTSTHLVTSIICAAHLIDVQVLVLSILGRTSDTLRYISATLSAQPREPYGFGSERAHTHLAVKVAAGEREGLAQKRRKVGTVDESFDALS